MHCVAAVHGPLAPAVHCTALAASADGTCWSGAADGSITCWRRHSADAAVQPVAVLQGHSHPVVALLSGLTVPEASSSSSTYLLSLDAEGWVGLWDCGSWVCLDMTRAAPLPPACTPSLLLMPDGESVCIIIPATPHLQQEQQTLWQHQRQHQQQQAAAHASPPTSPLQQQHSVGSAPATAANLSPMMLVLRWRSLGLVAAPLVSNLGLVALTSSSVTLDAADAVVAAAVVTTAPALAPAAADTVVLAVMRSGWMWAGSLAGASLSQAWEKPLVTGGSSAPLRHSCLWATTSSISSNGSNGDGFSRSPTAGGSPEQPCKGSAAALQLQLLLVQPDGWRLFVCSSFGSSDGMPCKWVQLAQQLQPVPTDSRMHSHSRGSRRQGAARSGLAVGAASMSGASARVRFEVGGTGLPAASEACHRSRSDGTSSSSSSSSESGSESDEEGEDAGAESEGSVVGRKGSRLQRVAGPTGSQDRTQGLQLLGGTLLQLPAATAAAGSNGVGSWQQQQVQSAAAEVVVWSACGEQQLWSVPCQPAGTSNSSRPDQQQQQVLIQQLQLQPWPAHAAAKVFPAINRMHTGVSLLVQHSRHTHHHHHHHHHQHRQQLQQQDDHAGDSSADVEWLLSNVPHKWRSDWHLHCMQLQAQDAQQAQHSSSSSSPAQQLQLQLPLQLQLRHCQGALGAAWCLHPSAHYDSSSSSQHAGSTQVQSQQQAADSSCSAVGDDDAMQVDTDGAGTGGSSSSRKRPAAEEPASEAATDTSEGPSAGRAKQPRVQAAAVAGGPHRAQQQEEAAGQQSAAAWLDGQQQQHVTHMLLLSSDAPGMHQVAVILASGTILFYDLATYCVPGAAWHPDCCAVGCGHSGRVSTTLEVSFRCPPQHMLGCAGGGADSSSTAGHGSLARPVNWSFSSGAAGRGDQSRRSSYDAGSGDGGGGGSSRAARRCEEVPKCPAAAQGWCARPAQGGVVPLLLTGGRDGSLRAWDLRLQHCGATWSAVHPHTAPVEAIVLPPVASRLPWSTCVLSVCAAGRVALTCLASGCITRTFDGWDLGPPAQLAWSTGRGLLAAGGWDAAGVWQVAVWDTYSGHMDRQLQGASAHMLMASLTQELTSSMRHLSRAQAAPQPAAAETAAAGGAAGAASSSGAGQYYASSSGSKRSSFDVPLTGSSHGAASGDGAKASGSSSSGASSEGGFAPRLQLVAHTGPLRPVRYGKQDVLLVDIDVRQLVQQLEAHSKQHKRECSRQRQQYGAAAASGQRASMDVDGSSSSSTPSARASRASSLDLYGLVQGGSPRSEGTASVGVSAAASTRTSPQAQQQQQAPRASAAAGQLHALQAAAAGMSRQGSVNSAAGATAGERQRGVQGSGQHVHSRVVMAPAVAGALQALCLLHRWGWEPKLDRQVVLLLEQLQGWHAGGVAGSLLTLSSSTSLPLSPTTPSAAAAAAAAAAAFDTSVQHVAAEALGQQPWDLLAQLQLLLEGPASGSPVLQPAAPYLSQDVLLSPRCHAAVIGLPIAHSNHYVAVDRASTHQQQQQQAGHSSSADGALQRVGSGSTAGVSSTHAAAAAAVSRPSCVLVAACPSLRACRLLAVVAVSKWLMATVPSHTSVNTCSGLVTLYALHSTELLTQAAAAQACVPPAAAATVATSPGAVGSRGSTAAQVTHQLMSTDSQQVPVLPDLLLVASVTLACPGLLADTAQLLLAAMLQPTPPGTYLLPTLSHQQAPSPQLGWSSPQQQQKQQQPQSETQVFTSPGAAAAASCWPPVVLQLAVLHAQQQQQQQQPDASPSGAPHDTAAAAAAGPLVGHHAPPLWLWLPQLVLATAAAVSHPTRMPPELLAAVSAGLLDVLLGAAPAPASCVAASWLCQVLRGGHWDLWRPYLGKPGHLTQRLCHLIDRLQASSTDSRTAASHLVSQSLSSRTSLLPGSMHSSSGSSSSTPGGGPGSSTPGSNFLLLSQQPYAVADPSTAFSGVSRGTRGGTAAATAASSSSNSSSGWVVCRPQHVEGGLFLCAALMGSSAAGGASRQGSLPPNSLPASPAAGSVTGLLEVSPVGALVPGSGSGAFGSGSGTWSAAGNAPSSQHQQQQQAGLLDLHRTSSGLTYSYTGQAAGSPSGAAAGTAGAGSAGVRYGQHHAAGPLSSSSEQQQQQQQQQQLSGVRVSRTLLVVWLRAALDVLAALTHVDPAAVLMELSHKLAGPTAESYGTSLTLLLAALSRLLKRPSERTSLLPHLGFITALSVQALDPARPLLRQALLQPVSGVIKDLSAHFPQVACHSASLQVAVGSTRALAGHYSGAAAAAAAGSGGGAVVSCIQAPTVAVFDMNGGTKKKVLLLPVLMDDRSDQQQQQQQGHGQQQQQQQHSSGAGVHHGLSGPGHAPASSKHVGPFGSTGSLQSTTSSVSAAADTAGGGALPHMSGALPGLWSAAEGVPGAAAAAGGGPRPSGLGGVLAGSSSSLSSSTTYTETPGDSRRASFAGLGELQRSALTNNTMTRAEAAMVEGWFGGSTGSSTGAGPGSASGGAGPSAVLHPAPGGSGELGSSSSAAGAGWGGAPRPRPSSMQCGVIYPDAASASSPVLCASEVAGGVAAVAFSPGGDAVAAFVLGCHCLVVWRLGSSWTQKLAHLGSSRPMSQMPHAYIRLPQAALLVHAVFKDAAGAAGPQHHQQQQQPGHRHHHHQHHQHGQRQSEDGEGGVGGEVLQWQLKWQTDSHIDLLYDNCLCGSVEVHL